MDSVQNRCHYSRLLLLHPAGNIPRMARGDRRYRLGTGSKTLPFTSRLTGRPSVDIRIFRLRPGISLMATYSLCGR